jgi:uncharacterized FlaG/YvyC family protein
MKVAETNQLSPTDMRPNAPEPARALSEQNRDATVSPAAVDAAPFDKGRLKEALEAAERLSELSNRRLKFEYHEEADVFQVSIVEGEIGGEVIRKIPSDNILRMIENLKALVGVAIDTKA